MARGQAVSSYNLRTLCIPGLRARARQCVRPVKAHSEPSAPSQGAYNRIRLAMIWLVPRITTLQRAVHARSTLWSLDVDDIAATALIHNKLAEFLRGFFRKSHAVTTRESWKSGSCVT